jgi:hypothetical protein
MADGYPILLYDNAGQQIGDALTDVDLTAAENRELVIDNGGKIYVWNQRNAQWRESAGVITLGKEASKPAEAETKAADKDK